MPMLKRGSVVLLLILAAECGGGALSAGFSSVADNVTFRLHF